MPRGMGRRGKMSNEKAKDFKGTMKKLMAYLSAYKIGIFFVVIFAIGSTIFNHCRAKGSRKSNDRDF